MFDSTEREVVINYHSAARIHLEPEEKFVFHPIESASWVAKGSEGSDCEVQSHRKTTSLNQQQITEQTFLCLQELKKLDDETKAGEKDPSIGWVSYPHVDEILTDTAKRYIQSLQVDENGQFVSSLARTEAEGEEGSLRATHIDTSLPITLDEPFNQLPWQFDLSKTGFKMEDLKAANHPRTRVTNQVAENDMQSRLARMNTSLRTEPEVQPELDSLDVEFGKPKGDDETGYLRLFGQARIRDFYIDLDKETLQTFESTVRELLNNIDPTSDLAITIRGTGQLPKSAKETLLGIGAPIFQSCGYTGDQMRAMSYTREPIYLELSVPSLQPRTLSTDTVYDKARATALADLDYVYKPEDQDNAVKNAGRASLAKLHNSTIDKLESLRPSEVSLTHWSDMAKRVMETVASNSHPGTIDGFGTEYTYKPKLTTFRYDGAPTSCRDMPRLTTVSNLEDATHFKIQLFKVRTEGGNEDGGADEEEMLVRGQNIFALMPAP